jgi:hypothetical protein
MGQLHTGRAKRGRSTVTATNRKRNARDLTTVCHMKLPLPDRDALLTRDETAVALTAAGYPIRSATLCTKATRGGGPPFRRFGTRSLYRWGDAIDWAEGRATQRQSDDRGGGAPVAAA